MPTQTSMIRLKTDQRAPGEAREWLSNTANLDRVRRAQALLLVSELVTGAVNLSPTAGMVTVTMDPGSAHITVGVEVDGIHFVPDGFPAMILDGFAMNWGRGPDPGRVWFQIPLPGAADRAIAAVSNEELLHRISGEPDAAATEELIARFTPMALRLARRYKGKGVADDDVDQAALFGLYQALNRYDASRGPVEPYATMTVIGELKRLLRDRGWSLSVPRQLKDRALEVGRATQVLGQRLGRPATPQEIADDLGIAVSEVLEAQACSATYQTTSLDTPRADSDLPLVDPADSRFDPGADWDRHSVGAALALVSEEERRLLHLRFYEEKTQSEIASELGISQMHVSRLLSRVMGRLQVLLEG